MENQVAIRVMVVDDQFIVRSGLTTFVQLSADLVLVGEANDGEQAVQRVDKVQPDIILMDMKMPRMDGVAATRAILQKHPHIKIIALTSFKEEEMIQDVLQAGAIGYLLKDITADELAAAIHNVMAGRPALAPEALYALTHQQQQASTTSPGTDLTEREREVLALMVLGHTNPQISEKLFLSLSTVKFHVSSILSKFGAETRTQAVHLARQHHIVSDD